MPNNFGRTKRIIGYALIASTWLVCGGLVAYFAVVSAIYADLTAPHRRFFTRGTALESVTRQLYLDYFRPIWQHQPDCMAFDEDVIYVPRIGVARFHGPEFDTTITITPQRVRSQRPLINPGPLIVVTGDSQAMGWGVADNETFSFQLAQRYSLNTINTAVPSYGTARELMRLRKLGLLTRAAVLIIQYCENDADENHDFATDKDFIRHRGSRILWDQLQHFKQVAVSYPLVAQLTYKIMHDAVIAGGPTAIFRLSHNYRNRQVGHIIKASLPAKTTASEFLRVLDSFPELEGKPIVVLEISGWGEKTRFIPELELLLKDRPNIATMAVPFSRGDFFRFDDHMNSYGHRKAADSIAILLKGRFTDLLPGLERKE